MIARRLPWDTAQAWLPPVERREFWAVQALVLGIAALHTWVEYQHVLDQHSPIYLVPTTLFLIPIVYAAVNFGLRGSVLTAVWSAALTAPNVVLFHQGLEQVGELVQMTWITLAAVFVGSRVDRERAARLEAETREAARLASEERYRAIVDNVAEPILLLDGAHVVVEANMAAAKSLGQELADLRGRVPSGPLGDQIVRAVLSGPRGHDVRLHSEIPARWYEPVVTDVSGSSGERGTQVLLRDVTALYEREQGLEGLTRQTLLAREAEQRRIARELHDGPLQSLVQLWRGLDSLGALVEPAAAERLAQARALAEGVADDLRRFSRDLRPSVLDDLGIVPAIRAEAEALRKRSGMHVRIRVSSEPRRLDADLELALLRITQEALRNAERHSGASSLSIHMAFREHCVRLSISDDGRGMRSIPTASQLLTASHMGIIGMQERARLAGAQLRLRPTTPSGLTVEVEAPTAVG